MEQLHFIRIIKIKVIENRHTFEWISLTCIIIVGCVLNKFWPHKNFFKNLFILVFMLIIQKITLIGIRTNNILLKQTLKKYRESMVFGSFITKTRHFISARVNLIVCIIFISIYIISMYKLGCLENTPTGIYGGAFGAFVFFLGIQAYLKYICLLRFIQDLKKIQIKHYFFYKPARTEWIMQLAHEIRYIEKRFLILGIMYCIIYTMNLPNGYVKFDNKVLIQSPCNFLFIVTWGGIIIFFAFAVPIFIFLGKYNIEQ